MMSASDTQVLKAMMAANSACIAACQKYLQGSPADQRAQLVSMAKACVKEDTAENTAMAAMMKNG